MNRITIASSTPRRNTLARTGELAVRVAVAALIASLFGVESPVAMAAVSSNAFDDIWPINNPFTPGVDEGLPPGGNTINPGLPATAADQPNFEGEQNIIVGRTSSGTLIINGGSDLRYEDLIIGGYDPLAPPGEGGPPEAGQFFRGNGTVRIEGGGSLYNNNYLLLPPALAPGNPFGIVWGEATRAADDIDGFDLYIGRHYDGLMRLSTGGRAEIQDAVIIGDMGGSVGRLEVDGFESTMISGGYDATPGDDRPHQMIVGRLGNGTMNITNGGRVVSIGPALDPGEDIIGAVIGSDAFEGSTAPRVSGEGSVNLIGTGSTWTIGGMLQIGGFHDSVNESDSEEDLVGNDANYIFLTDQQDTLTIGVGALVTITTPFADPTEEEQPDRLDVVIGQTGVLNMQGGTLNSTGFITQDTPQTNPQQEVDRAALINDGVITGFGNVTTLQFRNRMLGLVDVTAGNSLRFSAGGQYAEPDNIPDPTEPEYPLSNYGVIRVQGTETAYAEIEFNRQAPDPRIPPDPDFQNRPFLNLPNLDNPQPGQRTEGLIHGQYSVMRFRTGLENRGVVAFTAGQNTISGNVVNRGETAPLAGDDGLILIGPNTNVVFEDDLINQGTLQVDPTGSFQVLAGNSFETSGTMKITVNGSTGDLAFNPYQIAGNATISGTLEVTLTGASQLFPPLPAPQNPRTVALMNVGGSIIGNFADVVALGVPFGSSLEFFTFPIGQTLFLQAYLPVATNGADFNGDGVVDSLDYFIWRQNYGTSGPAGDANGDMMVNAADYTIWRNSLPPGSGSGGLSGIGGGTVPEPTSGVLLAIGSMLAVAARRRHQA